VSGVVPPRPRGLPEGEYAGARLVALRLLEPVRWQEIVRAALVAHGSRREAAAALGVSTTTVSKWAAETPALVRGLTLRGAGRPKPART
jgi:hypothetical protein